MSLDFAIGVYLSFTKLSSGAKVPIVPKAQRLHIRSLFCKVVSATVLKGHACLHVSLADVTLVLTRLWT